MSILVLCVKSIILLTSWGFTPIFLAKSTGLIFYETIVFNNILAIMLNFEEDYGGKKEIWTPESSFDDCRISSAMHSTALPPFQKSGLS